MAELDQVTKQLAKNYFNHDAKINSTSFTTGHDRKLSVDASSQKEIRKDSAILLNCRSFVQVIPSHYASNESINIKTTHKYSNSTMEKKQRLTSITFAQTGLGEILGEFDGILSKNHNGSAIINTKSTSLTR